MIQLLEHKNGQTAKKILEISHKSYEIEAQIIEAIHFPPLNETVTDIQASTNLFYGFRANGFRANGFRAKGELAAVIEFEDESGHWLIARLVVQPTYFRQGIGSQLISFAKEKFEECVVSTAENNLPAISLYQKQGFVKLPNSRKELGGIKLVRLKYTNSDSEN